MFVYKRNKLSEIIVLDSHERSPKRETTSSVAEKKFVDVKLTASMSDDDEDDDEDLVFDRVSRLYRKLFHNDKLNNLQNNLLSSNKRQNASLIRGRADNQTIRLLILLLLFLIAGLVSSSTTLSVCSVRHEVIACLWTCIGMFCGAWSSKYISDQTNFYCKLIFQQNSLQLGRI